MSSMRSTTSVPESVHNLHEERDKTERTSTNSIHNIQLYPQLVQVRLHTRRRHHALITRAQ